MTPRSFFALPSLLFLLPFNLPAEISCVPRSFRHRSSPVCSVSVRTGLHFTHWLHCSCAVQSTHNFWKVLSLKMPVFSSFLASLLDDQKDTLPCTTSLLASLALSKGRPLCALFSQCYFGLNLLIFCCFNAYLLVVALILISTQSSSNTMRCWQHHDVLSCFVHHKGN